MNTTPRPTHRRSHVFSLRIALFLCLLLTSTFSWTCTKPASVCSNGKSECNTNSDCPNQTICWLCECISCSKGSLPCGADGGCIPVADNPEHCGACNNKCPRSAPICDQGTCVTVDPLPKEIYIAPGSYQMGSPSKEIGRYDDELLHKVTIKQGFTIWKTEITQAEYKQYVGGNPSHFEKCGDACPVENVTWHEALQMCNKMSQAQGLPECFTCELKTIVDNVTNNQQKLLVCTLKEQYVDSQGNPDPKTCWGYRLPTEAEWEFAARAGTQTATYKGELIDGSCGPDRELNLISWYCQNANSTQITGLKEPNKWGLYDMLGNVREWVWDFYAPYPNRPATDPIGPLTGSGRVVRGGSWSGRALESRAAYRYDHEPFRREYNLGFRVARNVTPPTTQK